MRKARAKPRQIAPDPRFNDEQVARFINTLMRRGKKTVASRIFYQTIDRISELTKEDGLQVWKKAIENLQPVVEVRSRRIGGANFQIPTEVRPSRRQALAFKWLITYAKERNGKSMVEKLAAETIAAAKGEGAAIKKKEDVHKMAEANKAFAHFRV
ncbi:MAG: 30S ribosomal protein S7 [Chitinophagales bacterium]|nr:30S ribosomal protein S7 [Chitinophagales bacterium]MDW8427467.1 30S ribosomal protein S7 [Chitinophagales bacterium]